MIKLSKRFSVVTLSRMTTLSSSLVVTNGTACLQPDGSWEVVE